MNSTVYPGAVRSNKPILTWYASALTTSDSEAVTKSFTVKHPGTSELCVVDVRCMADNPDKKVFNWQPNLGYDICELLIVGADQIFRLFSDFQ